MKISGAHTLPFPVAQVWDALLDPRVLVATIPGCERLEATGEHAYAMTVTAGVAAIKGTYDGSCALSDLMPHESLVMRLRGAGAPGTIDATVAVRFEAVEDDGVAATRITYDADAVVGGMVGGVGQRMLTSVSKRMAGEFFDNVGRAMAGHAGRKPLLEEGGPGWETGWPEKTDRGTPPGASAGQVFTAPAPPARATCQQDFLRGVALGAGLVVLGVLVGGLRPRRRR